jgi:amino acid transporter
MGEPLEQSISTDYQEGDCQQLNALGYAQVLARQLKAFSNFALSLSIICILAGGVTSFHLGLCSVGGASIGLGWPLVGLFALAVAATMGQLASRFPTAGGLYHWAAILGGRGWGWITAWFNLAGLITVLAAINVGTYHFAIRGLFLGTISPHSDLIVQCIVVGLITVSQAVINHFGIRATAKVTDFSGYWIILVAIVLTGSLLLFAPAIYPMRLVTFTNYSGTAGAHVWPATSNLVLLFLLGTLLPAYTVTGFDASAHAAEETIAAAENVPPAIVRSVLVSVVTGWILLTTVVLAAPSLSVAANQGEGAFLSIMNDVLPQPLALGLVAAIVLSQYLCGLATVTSASRMAFAFARDGGLPFSHHIASVCPHRRSPVVAVWTVSLASILFTIHTPLYATITAVCTIFLYLSYVLPTALGAWTHGRSWTVMGPWNLGRFYRPLAILSIIGCVVLIFVGIQPPNERAIELIGIVTLILAAVWFSWARYHFPGPPQVAMNRLQ